MSVKQHDNNPNDNPDTNNDYQSFPSDTVEEGEGAIIVGQVPKETDENLNFVPLSHRFLTSAQRTFLISACYMSIAAILGALLRIALAQLFGEECANPGTVGWLASASPLCVTRDGEVTELGGIIFADLPANMLGSFIMGMMLSGDKLKLPLNLPIAWLSPDSCFQEWDIIHLAIRTGFCGSLTTFSSWNSEMVVLVFGTGEKHTQVVRAILGYIIGMETALGSFAFGSKVVIWIFRSINPTLAKEADAIVEKREQGVAINSKLPEFERQYLPDLPIDMRETHDPNVLKSLESWRNSTVDVRRVGHHELPALVEIENCFLVDHQPISSQLEDLARNSGWDIDALRVWTRYKESITPIPIDSWSCTGGNCATSPGRKQKDIFSLEWAFFFILVIYVGLSIGLISLNGNDAYSISYRTMLYAALVAPLGALLRWRLGGWNGKVKGEYSWLPAGTLTANIVGSFVSIAAIAIEYRLSQRQQQRIGFWTIGTLRSIKVGLAGCLTTVSTFVAEVDSFLKCPTLPYRGYIYIVMSLGTSAIVGLLVYGYILYIF